MRPKRVEPVPVDEFRPEWDDTLRQLPGKGLKGANAPVNVLGSLARSPENFGPYLAYWVNSYNGTTIPAREQQLVMLRVAWVCRSDYVWGHHVPPGLEAGLTRAEIDRVPKGPDAEGWSDLDRNLLQAVDELLESYTIEDQTWNALCEHLDETQRIDVLHLVTQYIFFSIMNNTLGCELEPGIERLPIS